MPVDLLVIGLGYVGLPLALEATRSGLAVLGVDTDPQVVATLSAGRSHVDDISDDDVATMLAAGFRAGTDPAVAAEASTVVVCVPTPLSGEGGPDLGAVLAATAATAPHLRPGALFVLESTTYPGTTEEMVQPLIEATGRTVGVDVHLAFSPERIDPGNLRFGLRNTPKVVGGVTAECSDRAAEFYGRLVEEVVRARGTREAEMSKLLENTYRHVNIALVNEMAQFCHELDIDLWDVIRCASSKPFGFAPFRPGPGVGGHCIPIDPTYLSHRVRARLGHPFRVVELAQEINAAMPQYVARRVQDLLNDDGIAVSRSRILLLGITYKPDIADQRESPARPLARRLVAMGAEVSYHDPHIPAARIADLDLTSADDLELAVKESDLVVLLQDHRDYDREWLAWQGVRVLDTRGVLPAAPTVEAL